MGNLFNKPSITKDVIPAPMTSTKVLAFLTNSEFILALELLDYKSPETLLNELLPDELLKNNMHAWLSFGGTNYCLGYVGAIDAKLNPPRGTKKHVSFYRSIDSSTKLYDYMQMIQILQEIKNEYVGYPSTEDKKSVPIIYCVNGTKSGDDILYAKPIHKSWFGKLFDNNELNSTQVPSAPNDIVNEEGI